MLYLERGAIIRGWLLIEVVPCPTQSCSLRLLAGILIDSGTCFTTSLVWYSAVNNVISSFKYFIERHSD